MRPAKAALAAATAAILCTCFMISSQSAASAVSIVERRVSASADDAEQAISSSVVSLNSTDLEMNSDGGSWQQVGIRFTDVVVPRGATVTDAYVQFTVDETKGTKNLSVVLTGFAQDNAPVFTAAKNDIGARPTTSSSVTWNLPTWTAVGASGAAQRTPNLAAIVAEITSRPGWASGNALAVKVTGPDSSNRRVARAWDSGSGDAPLLHIEYEAATPTSTATTSSSSAPPTPTPTPTAAPSTPSPAPSPTASTPTPTPTASAPAPELSVGAFGSRLVDATGATVQLRGVNRSGTQYACSEGWGIFDGPSDQASIDAIKSWKANSVRVSLNDACWLGINGVPSSYSGANYQAAIKAYVNRLVSSGLYVILDLHFANPGPSLQPDQVPMPSRDHDLTFWSSVASTFKSNPAVLFDLFNEPYPDGNRNTAAAWTCIRDGGTCPGVSYPAAGSQEMLNAIRSTGARNVVLVGGPQYAGDVGQWSQYQPTDPAGQLAASIHIYYDSAASPDWSPCYLQSCWDSTVAPLALRIPVVIGEFGEHDCTSSLIRGTALSPSQQSLLSWADAHGISYLGWSWFTGNCAGEPALISDYSGTPTAYGAGIRDFYQTHS
jgi:endoglucanase